MEDMHQKAVELTSYMMHKHYCENDGEAIAKLLGEPFSWFGPGEKEYAIGKEAMTEILKQFNGLVPKCNIYEEEYDVLEITPEVLLCTGKMWIVTDPSTNIYLRVHQRVTALFRCTRKNILCCHMHLSNPYVEMTENDIGFPARMGRHSYEYLQEKLLEQRKQIEMQTKMLEKMSFEDSLTGLFNRNKFNHVIENFQKSKPHKLGIAYFDLNGLKPINDKLGHMAGDKIICRTASYMNQFFPKKAYRIGGDEFVIICDELEKDAFYKAIHLVREHMAKEHISVSIGCSWREGQCDSMEQFEEADHLMYQEKAAYYSSKEHNRRKS